MTQVVIDGALRACAVGEGGVVEREGRCVRARPSFFLQHFTHSCHSYDGFSHLPTNLHIEALQQEVTQVEERVERVASEASAVDDDVTTPEHAEELKEGEAGDAHEVTHPPAELGVVDNEPVMRRECS